MKTIISVGGRFHSFNLAYQLQKRGALLLLITSYPKIITKKYKISPVFVRSVLIKEMLGRVWYGLPFLKKIDIGHFVCTTFDYFASRYIKKCDVFVGWSTFAIRSGKKAKMLGAINIVERGSTHILFQNEIIKEEYEKFGLKFSVGSPESIQAELKSYDQADYISVPSNFVKNSFLNYGFSEEKILVTPYGVDTKEFKPVKKKDNVFRVIFCGQITTRKGVYYLLKAFSQLKLKNSELVLIGSISQEIKPVLKKFEGVFTHIPHQRQSELYKYYSQGSVYVLPSIEEGMAMTGLQAMACGLPVIGTPNAGFTEIIKEGREGFIVPIRNIKAIREKLLYLYNHPEKRKRMGLAARETARKYTWDKYGEKIFRTYQTILKNN